jgi:hypothetical protein
MTTWADEYLTLLEDCERRSDKLSDWECGFVDSLQRQLAEGRQKGFGCEMGIPELKTLLLRCNGRCEVSGMKLHTVWQGKRHPMAPSIDRIDSTKGYVRGNCRVVCYAVNVAMLHWGEDVFGQIATGWVLNKYTVLSLAHKLQL